MYQISSEIPKRWFRKKKKRKPAAHSKKNNLKEYFLVLRICQFLFATKFLNFFDNSLNFENIK